MGFTTRSRLAAALAALTLLSGPAGCGAGDPTGPDGTAATAGGSPSAAPEKPAPGDHRLTIEGRTGEYELHAPPGYRPGRKTPLVVAIHYRGADVKTMRDMTRLDATADREGFLVAYPCCGGHEDVGFVRAMVEHLVRTWDVDPDRVYATGMSAGGSMAFRLATEAPDLFAAIAPVSSGLAGGQPGGTGGPARSVSVLSFIGTDDRNADALEIRLVQWRREYGCVDQPLAWVDRAKTVNRVVSTCPGGTEVVGYTINGMGHNWPGGAALGLGAPDTAINATELIWDFFAAHPRRAG
ncbi:alpha/beta hydrolase family esterase [Micromonospora endolithica]|uniref:Polyhydroxybutyrate depolymerase n=1 Tax=Micromonospora endolithica TaxID=230091 RepID=A0A3A9Z423_9ACTN|nr:PHB depolymerase family esterase [Micromonospora endolithica]RKN42779.1 polyhydroxybutyrate depolymerase [Micromonospora endolithica]TWJ25368.1 polyhydroxybutyrate depolymerase [Micromonospora endolithica]